MSGAESARADLHAKASQGAILHWWLSRIEGEVKCEARVGGQLSNWERGDFPVDSGVRVWFRWWECDGAHWGAVVNDFKFLEYWSAASAICGLKINNGRKRTRRENQK